MNKHRWLLRKYIVLYKRTRVCYLCGETKWTRLTFHHRDVSQKRMNVGAAIGNRWSLDTLKKEIAKCDVICKECHKRMHDNGGENSLSAGIR